MLLLLLVLIPMCMAPVCWLISRRSKHGRDLCAILTGFAELGLAIFAAFRGGQITLDGLCGLGLHLTMDGFRAVYCVVLAFMWAMTLLFSPDYFAHHHRRSRYYFFQLLTLGATMGVFLASDLFTAFVFFEIMSFASFPWVIQEETDGAIRAAKTYLAVSVIGGLAALMGLFLLGRYLGTLELSAIYPAPASALLSGASMKLTINTFPLGCVTLTFTRPCSRKKRALFASPSDRMMSPASNRTSAE